MWRKLIEKYVKVMSITRTWALACLTFSGSLTSALLENVIVSFGLAAVTLLLLTSTRLM